MPQHLDMGWSPLVGLDVIADDTAPANSLSSATCPAQAIGVLFIFCVEGLAYALFLNKRSAWTYVAWHFFYYVCLVLMSILLFLIAQ